MKFLIPRPATKLDDAVIGELECWNIRSGLVINVSCDRPRRSAHVIDAEVAISNVDEPLRGRRWPREASRSRRLRI